MRNACPKINMAEGKSAPGTIRTLRSGVVRVKYGCLRTFWKLDD